MNREELIRQNEERKKKEPKGGKRTPEEIAAQSQELGEKCLKALENLTSTRAVVVSTKGYCKAAVEQVMKEFKQNDFRVEQTVESDENSRLGYYIKFS